MEISSQHNLKQVQRMLMLLMLQHFLFHLNHNLVIFLQQHKQVDTPSLLMLELNYEIV